MDVTVIIIHRYKLVYALEFGTMSFDLIFELNIRKFVCALCHFWCFCDRNDVFSSPILSGFQEVATVYSKNHIKPKLLLLFSALSHNKQFQETNAILIILGKEIKALKKC